MENHSLDLAGSAYKKLVEGIVHLYQNARESLARFYWGTGRRIVEVEQKGKGRAPHGTSLLKALSEDLTRRLGSGFSVRNLERMRAFYLINRRKSSTSTILSWSQNVELLALKDEKKRSLLEKRVIREGLTSRQIRALIRGDGDAGSDLKKMSAPELAPLKRPADLRLYTYKRADLISEAGEFGDKNGEWIDCGFYVRRKVTGSELKAVTLTDTPAYTYPAFVDRIVDGDTMLAVIDAGFGNVVHWRLRLRGIDSPELSTAEGTEAKRYVETLLPRGTRLVLKSTKTDVHGRFVADVFFKSGGAAGFDEIVREGVWFNQHLLDRGHAVRKDA